MLGCVAVVGTLGIWAYAEDATPDAPVDLSMYDPEKIRIAQAMVDQAMTAFGLDPDSAIAAIGDPGSSLYRDGELFVVVADEGMTIVAHGDSAADVGRSLYNMTDPAGANLGDMFHASQSHYGSWVEYLSTDTGTGETEKRLVWAKTQAGYLYAVGMSPSILEMDLECEFAADAPQKQFLAQRIVEQAIADFGTDKNSTLAAIMDRGDATYMDAELFVADGGLIILAHRTLPDAVGFDMSGTTIGEVIRENASPYGKWVQYDLGQEIGKKHTWVKTYSGYTFGIMTACG